MVSSISENPTNHRRIGKRVAKTVFVEGMMRALTVAAGPADEVGRRRASQPQTVWNEPLLDLKTAARIEIFPTWARFVFVTT
jgi:hypothetical protein